MLTWETFADSYPSFYFKTLRKEEESRREEMIKARPETHETEQAWLSTLQQLRGRENVEGGGAPLGPGTWGSSAS